MENMDGRVAVVTGGASGIGRALAHRFAREGMSVALADVDVPRLEAVAAEIVDATAADVLTVPTDVSSPDAVAMLAELACRRFGTVHVVCNNAGVVGQWATAWETPEREWRWVLDVNLWGVVNGISAFVPLLVAQDEGHVVNTASVAAWQSPPGSAAYAASKHAVLGLSEVLRLELEDQASAVGVSVLCPRFVDTPILSAARNWPADRLGDAPPPGTGRTRQVREAVDRAISSGTSPDVIAELVVDGIRANRFVLSEDVAGLGASADRRAAIARGAAPRGRA